MTIVRGPRLERNFTILDNNVLRDTSLSFRSRGVLGYLLSLPPDSTVSAAEIARQGSEGREAIRSALTELEAAGYLVRGHRRRPDGTFTSFSTIYEQPQTGEESADSPAPRNPPPVPPADSRERAGQTGAQKPASGFLGDQREGLSEEGLKQEGLTACSPQPEPITFEDFWSIYPLRAKPPDARRAWDKAIKTTAPEVVIQGVIRYRDDPNRDPAFTAYPASWLNSRRWEDDPLPARPLPRTTTTTSARTLANLAARRAALPEITPTTAKEITQ